MEREAEKFRRKADLRSHWLTDKKAILEGIVFEDDVEQIQKATKMVDSVDADIGSKVRATFLFDWRSCSCEFDVFILFVVKNKAQGVPELKKIFCLRIITVCLFDQ